MRRCALFVLLVLAMLLAGCSAPDASGLFSVTAVIGEEHVLRAGDRALGDVYALAGRLTVEEGASVRGSLLVLGGEVALAGAVEGDVSLLGGRLRVLPPARIAGGLAVAGGSLDLAQDASIAGGVRQSEPLSAGSVPRLGSGFGGALLGLLLPALGAAAAAYLLARYLARPYGRVAGALGAHFVVCGAMGFLAGVTALVLLVLVAFTVLLIPFSLAGAAGMLVATGYGWSAFGAVGGRLLLARWPRVSLPAAAALGGFCFTLALALLGRLPLFGPLLPPLAAAAGLGAVILTRFGLREFVPAVDAAPDWLPDDRPNL
jgi:hypothetical protein